MMLWGYALDMAGSAFVRVASMVVMCAGTLLCAYSNSEHFDAFVPAGALLGCGGAGFFFSHFVLADHFKDGGNFGLVHTLLNAAMDSATLTYFVLEVLQRYFGVRVKAYLTALAAVYGAFIVITPLWGKYLRPAEGDGDGGGDAEEEAAVAADAEEAALAAEAPARNSGDVSKLPFLRQLRTPHFGQG